uniref:Ribose-phosphate pyrophosphokinase n=1 Tax=Thelazia callipaeda TaxID=103827 RepID=A0A0N5CVS1_THECL
MMNSAIIRITSIQNYHDKTASTIVGDVGGKIAIIVDDVIDEAQTYKIHITVTHGLLSADAPAILEKRIVSRVLPHETRKLRCHKTETIVISLLRCDAIRQIYSERARHSFSKRCPQYFDNFKLNQ